MSDGMAGMVHERDLQIAEGMADLELPAEYKLARGDMGPDLQRGGRQRAHRPRL